MELFAAIGRGEVKAVWIMGTNPVVSLPDSHAVSQALAACPLVIVSDVAAQTDTGRFAHIRFPALAWGEKNGTVTNSERRISRQRSFLPPPGEAKADWWIIARVGQALGYREAFAWQHPHDVFREHAALSGFENDGQRAFDIGALADLSREAWDAMPPVRWPVSRSEAAWDITRGWHGDGRLRMVPVTPQPTRATTDAFYPLILNSGRIRDQWHTMTRTGAVPRLMQHIAEPMVEVAPQDAVRYQLPADGLARIWSRHGVMVAKVAISEGQRPGSLFVPMHWNNQFARQGRVNNLLAWHQGRLMLGWWSDAREPAVDCAWISAAFAAPPSDAAQRHALLSGRPGAAVAPRGRIVCSCFGVGEWSINEAIASGCASVGALGGKLKCGTNCGSCVPELNALLAAQRTRA